MGKDRILYSLFHKPAFIAALFLLSADIFPYFAYAGGAVESPIKSVNDIERVLGNIATYTAEIFWIIAIIMIFYSAILFLVSGGDSEKVKKARQQLLYAVIAIGIGILAYGIPTLVKDVLTPSSSPPSIPEEVRT